MAIFSQGVMLGPIAGPVIGGYLTEYFDWRMVFYVNIPIGIVATFVLLATLPRLKKHERRFDVFGWVLIALALAGMQLLLDRGQSKDWFEATEIVVWAGLCAAASWMFLVHMATTKDALFPRELFRDRNLLLAMGLFFLIGLVMLSIMALLPSLLQSIYGFPAIDAGWLLTPRGFGILVTITLAGKLADRIDSRILIGFGRLTTAYSLHMMSGWGPDLPSSAIVTAGFIQGFGLGFAFVPINSLAFATIDPGLRTDAASLINLSRNLGASFGIAVTSVFLARSIQVNHAELSANLALTRIPVDADQLRRYGETGEMGLSVLDALVNRQAVMIGYINDFHAMSIACLLTVPLVMIMRKPPPLAGETKPAGSAA
jgi:DHA2 family multidrug resistance protein